jgi:hypothetical protein
MTARILDLHAETFVSGSKALDLDFDGLPDILATRDFGAKWATYCVWLFDPNQGRFIQNPLSRQMEDLENLTVDDKRQQIVAFTIGPTYPNRDEYRIDRRSAIHAQRRLLAVRSCELDTAQTEGAARTVSVVTYTASREIVQRRTVSADRNDACGDGCSTMPAKGTGRP